MDEAYKRSLIVGTFLLLIGGAVVVPAAIKPEVAFNKWITILGGSAMGLGAWLLVPAEITDIWERISAPFTDEDSN